MKGKDSTKNKEKLKKQKDMMMRKRQEKKQTLVSLETERQPAMRLFTLHKEYFLKDVHFSNTTTNRTTDAF